MHKIQVMTLQQGITIICMHAEGRPWPRGVVICQKRNERTNACRAMYRSEKLDFSPNCGIMKISKRENSKGQQKKERAVTESIKTKVRCANREGCAKCRCM